jgi:hypothetical protein
MNGYHESRWLSCAQNVGLLIGINRNKKGCAKMSQEDRDWYRGKHPPACTCVTCEKLRILKQSNSRIILQPKEYTAPIKPIRISRQGRKWNMSGITKKILIFIAIVFALLAGLSGIAWLLPTAFTDIGVWLVNNTGNQDIAINILRIQTSPINYLAIFGGLAIAIRWLADRF